MKYLLGAGYALSAWVAFSGSVAAKDPFSIDATITNGTQAQNITESFSSVRGVVNFLHNSDLSTLASSYTPVSGVAAHVSYLGVPVTLSYAANSTTLVFQVPGLGLTQSFTGQTRDESASQFYDFLKGKGQGLVNDFQRYLTTSSPVSPIAGNPNSLQAAMIGTQFSTGAFNTGANATSDSQSGSRFGVGASAGEFSVRGFTGQNYELPISYTYRFDDPRWQLQVSLPLGYQRLGNAESYSAQFGIGLQIPLLSDTDWYLVPAISGGAVGSLDVGAAGVLYSGAVSSRYTWHADEDLAVTLGDMIGRVESVRVAVAGYDIDPRVSNTLAKNGLEAEYTTGWSWFGEPLSVRGSVAYTHAWGSKLDIPSYTEFSLDFGTLTSSDAPFYKRLRVGATYTTGSSYHAARINLGYTF